MCMRVRKGIARTLALMLSVMLLLEFLPGVAKAETVTISVTGTFQGDARATVDMMNAFRTGGTWYWNETNTEQVQVPAGTLGVLTYDYYLEQIAMQRALEIAISFSHTRPDGSSCFTCSYNTITSNGENIAIGYGSAESAYIGFREDDQNYSGQGHRRNMLDKDFTRIGIAYSLNGEECYWAMILVK